jgi:hypothetical protein
MADTLEAFEARLIREAREEHRMQVLQWTILAQSGRAKQKNPPKLPEILKGLKNG